MRSLTKPPILIAFGVVTLTTLTVITVKKCQEISASRQDLFSQGQEAYQDANCYQANQYFDKVEAYASFPFNSFDGLTNRSLKSKEACSKFIVSNNQASQAERDGNLSKTLFIHYEFIKAHKDDVLTNRKRHRITTLFGNYGVAKLAGSESCDNTDQLVKADVFPNKDSNLPHFYYHCGKFYAKVGQAEQELDQYGRFLGSYPRHSLTKNVQLAAVKNNLICSKAPEFQGNKSIAKLSYFMPVVYLSCGQADYGSVNYPEARKFFSAVRQHYPKHPLSKSANNLLFQVNQEVGLVKKEINKAGEIIQLKIAACTTASSIGLDWWIDITEAWTGKSCGLEERLEDWERVVTVIPIIDGIKGASRASKVFQFLQAANSFSSVEQTKNAIQNDQALFDLLQQPEAIRLFAHHNNKLNNLVLSRINNPIDTSKQTQFLSYLK